jgi:hypothetical protein
VVSLTAQDGVEGLKVRTIPMGAQASCDQVEKTLPVPSPAFLAKIADVAKGPIPRPWSRFGLDEDPPTRRRQGDRVIWSVRATIQPSFSEDGDFTFLEFEDLHKELVFAKPLILNYWYQLYGNTCLLTQNAEPSAVAEHLLWSRWIFDSRRVPEVASMMDAVRGLKKGLNYQSPTVGMDGTTYTFEFLSEDGSLKVTQWERNGANTEVVDWAEKCFKWLQAKTQASWEADLKEALRRMDKGCVGTRVLASALRGGQLREALWVLEAGVSPDGRDEDETPLLVVAVTSLDAAGVKLLLDHGANPNLADACGRTALHHLALLDRKCVDEARQKDWKTLIPNLVRSLVAAGVKPGLKDSKGHTAKDLAVAAGNLDLVKALGG